MRGIIARWRQHPVLTDGAFAAVVLLVDASAAPFQAVPTWLWVFTAVLLALPLAARRRWPRTSAAIVLVGGAVWLATHEEPTAFHFALVSTLVLLYTLLVHRGRREALAFALLLLVGIAMWSAWRVGPAGMLGLLWLAIPWALGSAVLSARTQGAEAARRAAAEERVAIAREMHDTIAHALTVMVVLADGAAAQVRGDPRRAEQALRTVAETGRAGLGELRRVLDVLRDEVPDASRTQAAQPVQHSGTDLVELVQRMTSAGLPTRLTLAGSMAGLPATVSSGLYRIAQESLTNALRHGGAGSRATVEIVTRDGEVELSVRDDGAGAGRPVGRGGSGLTGMRERANACGGTLTAGPDPEHGGWTVRAVLPT